MDPSPSAWERTTLASRGCARWLWSAPDLPACCSAVTSGWLFLVWEPVWILSILGFIVFLLTLAVRVRQYGMGGPMPYVLFALVLACAFGCLRAPEQIATILRTGTAPGLPDALRAP